MLTDPNRWNKAKVKAVLPFSVSKLILAILIVSTELSDSLIWPYVESGAILVKTCIMEEVLGHIDFLSSSSFQPSERKFGRK